MQCPRCGTENRDGSNFCRYCALPLAAGAQDQPSGYTPSVPPPDPQAQAYGNYYPPTNYTPPAYPPARPIHGQIVCPRCGATNVIKGGTPLWAILVAVIGFFVVCFFSLFFLLIKEPNRCLHCGLEFK